MGEKELQNAFYAIKQLSTAHPTIGAYQEELALAHENMAKLYDATDRKELADQSRQEADTIRKRLAQMPADKPGMP